MGLARVNNGDYVYTSVIASTTWLSKQRKTFVQEPTFPPVTSESLSYLQFFYYLKILHFDEDVEWVNLWGTYVHIPIATYWIIYFLLGNLTYN